jgi:hypothetical protein
VVRSSKDMLGDCVFTRISQLYSASTTNSRLLEIGVTEDKSICNLTSWDIWLVMDHSGKYSYPYHRT